MSGTVSPFAEVTQSIKSSASARSSVKSVRSNKSSTNVTPLPDLPNENPSEEELKNNPREIDFINAKAFLLTESGDSKTNVYDFLVLILKKILESKLADGVETFEEISRQIKREKLSLGSDLIKERPEKSSEVVLAEIQKDLFQPSKTKKTETTDEEIESPLPNLMQMLFFFEQAGVGLNREETYRVYLALKRLVETQPLQSVRFWGKVFGTTANYYIAEGVFREGEGDMGNDTAVSGSSGAVTQSALETQNTNTAAATVEPARSEIGTADAAGDDMPPIIEDQIPKPEFKPPVQAPMEESGTGVNRKVYFVCSEPGQPWIKLPLVTPQQLVVARKIRKFFTGNLQAPVLSYPPFPGLEINYLRAQIARISAATHISPLGFYQFDEEEEEEEEGAGRDTFIENPEFEGMSVRDLVDPSMSNWVHHVQHILNQGRCRWWNPVQPKDEDAEEEEEEEKEEPEEAEPEVGPPLLTPLSEDAELMNQSPWSVQYTNRLVPQYAVAVVHSILWPGAHAFGFRKTFENIYIGYGHKYLVENYSPPPPPLACTEFPSGPEITEVDDPTPEDEAAHKAAQAEAEEAEEAGEEEEGGDEDDGDEDDD